MPGPVADDILQGLQEALAFVAGGPEPGHAHVHIPAEIDTRAMRERLGPSQEPFATGFALDLPLLRAWEEGRRLPDTTARAYLKVIDRAPTAVQQALHAA